MTPKLAAIQQQLGLLQSDVDTESQTLLNQIESARARTKTVFAGTRDKIAKSIQGVSDQVDQVNKFLDGLEQTNGGPTSPPSSALQGAGQQGAVPPAANEPAPVSEPAASWSGAKPA